MYTCMYTRRPPTLYIRPDILDSFGIHIGQLRPLPAIPTPPETPFPLPKGAGIYYLYSQHIDGYQLCAGEGWGGSGNWTASAITKI